jgi:single-stranded DNA-binding protein
MSLDVNIAVIAGRIAAPPELREFASGSRCLRWLITTTSESPTHRVDVLPVTMWDPPGELVDAPGAVGERVWVVAGAQRRFWDAGHGRRSRLELVAHHVDLRPVVDGDPGWGGT